MGSKKNTKSVDGTGLTALVTALAKRCTGVTENATTQQAIWCAILVSQLPRHAAILIVF
jgi:hypothetical protein